MIPEIGKPFPGDFLPEKGEGPIVHFGRDGYQLAILLGGLSESEIQAFQNRQAFKFALYVAEEVLFFLVEIPGVLDWSDAPYCVATMPRDRWPSVPWNGGPHRVPIWVSLVEAGDRKVRALQEFVFDEDFSEKLVEQLETQKKTHASAEECLKRITKVQKKMKPEKMVEKSVARFAL